MAASVSVTVGTQTPVQLASGLKRAVIQNMGPYSLFIGGSNVTDATGLQVPAGTPLPMPVGLLALESIYGIVDSGAGVSATNDVRVLTFTG